MKLYTNIKTRLLTTNPLVLLSGSLAFFVLFLLIVVCIQQMILIDLNAKVAALKLVLDDTLRESQNKLADIETLKIYISNQKIMSPDDELMLFYVDVLGAAALLIGGYYIYDWAAPIMFSFFDQCFSSGYESDDSDY